MKLVSQQIQSVLSKLFYFKLPLYSRVCPTNNLELPQKEWLNFFLKVSFFVHLMIMYITWKVFLLFKRRIRKGTNQICELSNSESPNNLRDSTAPNSLGSSNGTVSSIATISVNTDNALDITSTNYHSAGYSKKIPH